MIAVDTNILVYAHRRDSPFHAVAQERVRTLAEGIERWAIPWPCLHEFFAVVTRQRVFDPPSTIEAAMLQVDAWLESPSLSLLQETREHWGTLSSLLRRGAVTGAMIHDARIAAVCIEHAAEILWSADRDFGRFPQLRVENPLVA